MPSDAASPVDRDDNDEMDRDDIDPISDQENDDDNGLVDPNSNQMRLERSRYAESGVITKIKLVNFMCHEHLDVTLSPHVNFIHGENGSGKSAILVAISTCLGVKASDTNRGSSLKELIKQGQEWGQVELTIANRGPDAYDPEKYGKSITVRREITQTGSNYKIFNEKGSVVGRTKKDLQCILDHFNMQVDNPCVVMNQDTTKEFLLSNKNSDKYDFFLKATQLEQMGKTIDLINKDYENAGRYLEEAQRQLDLLDRDCKEKEHLYNCTQDLAVIDKQIDELRGQCLWAKVHEIGNDIETKRSDAMQYKEQLQDVHAQISKLTMEKEIANKDHEDAKQRLLLERNAINDDVQLRQTLEKSLQAAKKTVARFQSQLAQYEKSEQSAIKRRADLHNQLSGLEAQRSRDRFQEDQERAEQIHKLKLRIMEQSEQVKETQREADQARRELEQCREAVNQKKALLQQKLNNKSDIERELQRLQRAAADQLNRFGRDMPSLIERIRAESGKFRVQPVGPIGAYVNVRDKRYSAAVQHAISKKLLCGFIVDSFADQKSLSQLFQQFYRNPRDIPFILVLKQPTARYDIVPRNPAYGDHPRVVDVIEITDTWCYNAIIDRAHIDSTLLMPNAALAQRLLRDMEQRREMTPTILTPDLDRITLNKGSLNNVSNLGGDRQNSILENVTQADLEELQRNVREAHMQSQSIKAEQTELMKLVEKASDVARLANRKVQAMTSDLDTSKADLANLGKQATFDDDHIGGLILDLHDRIAKCEQLVDDAKADQAACHENLLAAQEEHDRTVRKVEEFNENASRAGSGLEKATDDVNQAMKALAEVQANMNKIGPFQHTLERKLQGFVQELDSLEEQMERVRQEALTQTSGRVLSPESSSTEIMKEVYRMEAKKQADREAISSDSIEQITAAYVKAKEDCETAKMKMAESQRDFNRIEKKLRASSKDWEVFKKRLSKQASYDFQYNMSQKGHEGHIRFDHERGTLQMFVKMQHHQGEADMTSDTKALSGGERSFTTLAFVIAVGESIRTPFRALDEFDIFMDSVNRKIAITLLMDLADKYRNRQFIFITPQDVSMVPTSPTTFVLMLKPPIRPSH